MAHEIGVKLAQRLWGDRFQVLVTTHLDKDHLHNHFCLNSVSFTDGKKFRGGNKAYWIMRVESDKICKEYNLSIIENPGKGKSYAEWKVEQEGRPTIRSLVRDEIDDIIYMSYTYKDFIRILEKRGYEIKRGKYTALKPTFSQRFIRMDTLGKGYSEAEIFERITAARNGIMVLSKPARDYNEWARKYEPKKLHGFKALYFYYLYLFGRIRNKETPQRVSFYMREELLKLDRYQKQFHFLYDNNIETMEQLMNLKATAESKINELTETRKKMYGKSDMKDETEKITRKLRELRKDVHMCDNIVADSERIRENAKIAAELEQKSIEENKPKKQKFSKER